jgi:hypothetical protein
MTATKIDGTAIARSIREKLGAKIRERQGANPRYKPSLKIVQGEWQPFHCGAYGGVDADAVQWATAPTRAPMCA